MYSIWITITNLFDDNGDLGGLFLNVQVFDFIQRKTSKTQVNGARYHKIGKVVYILDSSSLFGKMCP